MTINKRVINQTVWTIGLVMILCTSSTCSRHDDSYSREELITISHRVNDSMRMWVELDTTDWEGIDFIGTYIDHYELGDDPCLGCSVNKYWVFKGYKKGVDTITFSEYSVTRDLPDNKYTHVVRIR